MATSSYTGGTRRCAWSRCRHGFRGHHARTVDIEVVFNCYETLKNWRELCLEELHQCFLLDGVYMALSCEGCNVRHIGRDIEQRRRGGHWPSSN